MKKLFLMLMSLSLIAAGCSKDKEEENPVDSIPDDNASDYVEFRGNMMPFTRSNVNDNEANEARLFIWTQNLERKEYLVLYDNQTIPVNGATDCIYSKATHDGKIVPYAVTLSRSVDDPMVWEFPGKIKWSDYENNPISFFAIIEPKDCKYPLSFTGNLKPHKVERNVNQIEYDAINKEYYYSSGDLSDVMVAYTRECSAEEYANTKEVELNFRHLFPRVVLNAKLGEKNALQVKVSEAYIFGLQVNGTHQTDVQESFGEAWSNEISPLRQFIQMDLSQPVELTSEYQPLVDAGHEPHVIPQKVKEWTTFAHHDGAGIVMSVNIRNLHDNSWIVGKENEYELVYVPFPEKSLEYGRIYNIDIVFGALFRDNGTAYGFQLSYKPQIVDWDVETESVELKKKDRSFGV